MLAQQSPAARRPLILILTAFLLLGLVTSSINPLFESPDEDLHFQYVRWLRQGYGLPPAQAAADLPMRQIAAQPPLYYLLAHWLTLPIDISDADQVIRPNPYASSDQVGSTANLNHVIHGADATWPGRGAVLAMRVLRLFSLLLGAVTVAGTFALAWQVFPNQPSIAHLAALFVAGNPQFIFISTSVNNDNLVIAATTLTLLLLARTLNRPPTTRRLVMLGLALGLATLTKQNALPLLPLTFIILTAFALVERSWGYFWRWHGITFGLAFLVAGWWYVRNLLLSGNVFGLRSLFDLLPPRPDWPSWSEFAMHGARAWRSFWALFGWLNVPPPAWVYVVYNILAIIGAIGCLGALIVWWRFNRGRLNEHTAGEHLARAARGSSLQLWLLIIWCAIVFVSVWGWTTLYPPQGRYLFPALAAFAVLWAAGVNTLTPFVWRHRVGLWLGAGLMTLALIIPWLSIVPAYAVPAAPTPAAVAAASAVETTFDQTLRLRAVAVTPNDLTPGQTVAVTLFWQALTAPGADYSISLTIVDDAGLVILRQDSFPARGNYVTSRWRAGEQVRDEHLLTLPLSAPAPCVCRLVVSVTRAADGTPVSASPTTLFQVSLGDLRIHPRLGLAGIPNPVAWNFDDQIELVGYDVNRRSLAPGQTLDLALFWRPLQRLRTDYVVVTSLRPPANGAAAVDAAPIISTTNVTPTQDWQVGRLREEHYRLTIPANAAIGEYDILVSIFDSSTQFQLPVNLTAKAAMLGRVQIR
ncbi:MAG: DUF2142 domain-containing protein [Anaerolineae bacterium]